MDDSEFAQKELEPKWQLDELMREWRRVVSKFEKDANRSGEFSAKIENLRKKYNVKNLSELFVTDGFYPHYYDQDVRILFIGWQSYGLNGSDHIEEVHRQIKDGFIEESYDGETKRVSINMKKSEAQPVRIAYGILKGYPENGDDLPKATDISEDFAEEKGFSFAFMNLSKFSGKATKKPRTDKRLMDVCLKINDQLSKDFFAEEVKILNPHLIIGLDVVDDYEDYMGKFLPIGNKEDDELLKTGMLKTSLGEYPFINFKYFFTRGAWKQDEYFPKIFEVAKAILSKKINDKLNKSSAN